MSLQYLWTLQPWVISKREEVDGFIQLQIKCDTTRIHLTKQILLRSIHQTDKNYVLTWNFPASKVALMTTIFKSNLCFVISLSRPIKISVAKVLSWASSKRITPYASSKGSDMPSRKSIPSVMYLKLHHSP
ncbi:unnamed protein product [Schistosoma mattheei]|uniref:Uncharacterized protein n=1 Tax=Schistosoma mattheei TaxID=31246 RepID=A0A183PIK0_9TREM|nr:unnamed protein product [Schistosoma mattheei]